MSESPLPNDVILTVTIGVVLVAAAGAWLIALLRRKRAEKNQRNEAIFKALDQLSAEVNQLSLQMHLKDGRESIEVLASLDEILPAEIEEELERIRKLRHDLDRQLAAFAEQSSQSTLQSSLLTNRVIKDAGEIDELIAQVKARLRA